MGRSADADHLRPPPAWLHAGIDPGLLCTYRRREKENVIDVAQLEHSIREDLNRHAPRVMTVLRPVKVVITNYPEGQVEHVDVINNPEDPSAGTRKVPFSRELYIEQEDFREDPPKKFFRLSPYREVRLRCAYFITCTEVVKDASAPFASFAARMIPRLGRRRA